MKLLFVLLLCLSTNGYAQIIAIQHPTSFSVPEIKQKCYEELLKDINCKNISGLSPLCLKLNKTDTLLVFYSYEAFYQETSLCKYLKREDSAIGTVYHDIGFSKSLGRRGLVEWKPGQVLKNSARVAEPILMSELLTVLNDTVLRTIDTTIFISHSPDLYFSFFFNNKNINRVIRSDRSNLYPIISKILNQFLLLDRK